MAALDHRIPILIGLLADQDPPPLAALGPILRARFPDSPLYVIAHPEQEALGRELAEACGATVLLASEARKPAGISLDQFVAYSSQVLVLAKPDNAGGARLEDARSHYESAADWGWSDQTLNRPEPGPIFTVTANGIAEAGRRATLDRIVEYNRSLAARGEIATARSREWLLGADANHGAFGEPGLAAILSRFEAADALATHYGKLLRWSVNGVFAIFGVAAFFFALVNLTVEADYGYLVCIVLIAVLVFMARRWQIEPRALDYRALAEGLRVQFFWRLAGVPEWVSDNYLSKHEGVVAWIRTAIQAVEALDALVRTDAGAPAEGPGLAKKRWVEDQRSFYQKRVERQAPVLASLEWTVRIAEWSILGFAAVFGIWLLLNRNQAEANWFQFGFGVLAAIAIVARGYGLKRGFDHMATQYRLMATTFATALAKLERSDEAAQRALLARLGKEALIEHGEWLTTHRSRPLEILK